MRLQPPRRALSTSVVIALLSLPLFAAPYSSTSPQELQRRLEQDTNRLIDSLRSQRNSPSRSSSSGDSNSYYDGLREREQRERENRAEQSRLDAEWRRDHPNETRQQYFARIDREAAEAARDARRQREDAVRAQRAREAAERERQELADWARIRASWGGYMAQTRPPVFSTPAESLDWYLRHESSTHNEWAGNQAAMLLIEGIGVPQDIAKAVRLLDPNAATAKKVAQRHPESRALFAYLQLTFPDAVKAAGLEVNSTTARADLEDAAANNDLAKWYLARLLNNSAAPADQKRALQLITRGASWARVYFAGQVKAGPSGRDPLFKHLGAVAVSVVEKQRRHIAALTRELPLSEFETFDDLLPSTSEPLRTEAMRFYVRAIAERVVPLTPNQEFNYYAFDYLLGHAGDAGIDAVYGLAALHRFHLLGIEDRSAFKPSWTHLRDNDRTLAALTEWSGRDDVLGARARLAIQGFSIEAASSQWWTPSKLNEVIDYQNAVRERARLLGLTRVEGSEKSIFHLRDDAEDAEKATRKAALEAFARRDAAAPQFTEMAGLLAAMKIGDQWREELKQLNALGSAKTADSPSPSFTVTHASFDIDKAAALYDSAFAPETPETVRWHTLFAATRLGDAIAPRALAQELVWQLPSPATNKLRQLSEDRLARDEAAKRPRALLARGVIAFRPAQKAPAALTDAAAAGSPLARGILLNERIGATMARENDRPISWGLDPALIAEYDDALADGKMTGTAFSEWTLVRGMFGENEADGLSRNWFDYLQSWIADRDERRADAEFAKAILPQVDALIATLAEWPGLDQGDPIRREWTDAARRDREQAMELVRNGDGLGALRAFLAAAGRGDRGALELLARHIRTGDGGLPLSPEIADRLQTAAFKMTIADAEVGDAHAAYYIGECYREGSNGIAADPAQALAWLRYAADLGWTPAARTLAQDDAQGLARTPADLIHWTAVRDACEYNEFLPKPARRLTSPRIDLAAIRPQLEASITALNSFRTQKPIEPTSEQDDAEMLRIDAAKDELKKNPANGLVLFAQIAATGNRYIAHDIVGILARGDYGVQPEPALAKRFHAAGLALLERDAEYGDFNAAARLATYAVGLGEKPDIPASLRWLTYSAELGSADAAEELARLHTEGAPGLPADPAKAAHWTAFAESTTSENFKPRAPLR